MVTFFGFIILILCCVFFHEMGHFLVARAFKMRVLEFSIGMGKPLLSRTDRHGTVWKMCPIPIGGYVRMAESGTKNYHTYPVYQRFLMVLAGPVFSVVFGWAMFFCAFAVWGHPQIPDYRTGGIYQVMPDTPAYNTDLQRGDVIVKMQQNQDVYTIHSFYDMYTAVQRFKSSPIEATVKRGNTVHIISITPKAYHAQNGDIVYRIGVRGYPLEYVPLGVGETFNQSVDVTWRMVTLVYDSITRLLVGNIAKEELGGPIKIANMAGETLHMGWRVFIIFMGGFSINLGLFNMIPLPVLDGGRLVLLVAEGVRRRPIGAKVSHMLMAWSMAIVFTFLIFITLLDIGVL